MMWKQFWSQDFRMVAVSILSTFFAFLLGGAIVFLVGENPFSVLKVFVESSLLSMDGIAYSLFYATPLLFTGISVAFAFRCGLFNVGSEGQLYMGSIAAAITALYCPNASAFLLIPLLFFVSFFVGGMWGLLPGYFKVKFGSHEVINTIMFNLIAYGICNYLVVIPFKRKGDQILETEFIPQAAHIFRMHEIFPFIKEEIPLNGSFFVAIFLLFAYWIFFKYSRFGYEMKAVGVSPKVADYAGIKAGGYIIFAMFISGGFSGLIAVHEVMGFRYTFHDNFSRGVGFMGIAVALLGRNHPVGIFFAALLFGMLNRGSLFLDIKFEHLSSDLVMVLQGIIILFVGMSGMFEKMLPKAHSKF